MKASFHRFSIGLILVTLLSARSGNAACEDAATRGSLNVLTINILYSEFKTLDTRLNNIAQFVADQFGADPPEPVDVIALQEVVGGRLADALARRLGHTSIRQDTAENLRVILAQQFGLDYQSARALANGVPGVLAVYNATLSRCSIEFSLAKRLPPVEEIHVQGREIKLPRSVLMSRISIPEAGMINVYNTHLCSDCREEERSYQAQSLIDFVQGVDAVFPDISSILAGDFNINVASVADLNNPVYRLIRGAGFVDSYAESNPSTTTFCSEPEGGPRQGCTIGVSRIGGLLPNNTADHPARIDFIFFNREGLQVQHSRVVFNPLVAGDTTPSVSDHSAVFTEFQFARD